MDTFKIEADMNAALYGGDGDDRFVLADGIKYSGLLDGQSGSDTVDFSKYTTGRNILLTDTGAMTASRVGRTAQTGLPISTTCLVVWQPTP